jgi:hypothetical protein
LECTRRSRVRQKKQVEHDLAWPRQQRILLGVEEQKTAAFSIRFGILNMYLQVRPSLGLTIAAKIPDALLHATQHVTFRDAGLAGRWQQ